KPDGVAEIGITMNVGFLTEPERARYQSQFIFEKNVNTKRPQGRLPDGIVAMRVVRPCSRDFSIGTVA
ncbi:MAG: hypothetical protein ACRD9S_17235, partial [Pyrinomonadaceae bacterium]